MVSRRAVLGALGLGGLAAGAGGLFYGTRPPSYPYTPPSPPLQDARGRLLWRNWSGVLSAYPERRAAPRNEDEVADIVKNAPAPLRAVGSGHSSMPLVPTDGTMISLEQLRGVRETREPLHASVQAGTLLSELIAALHAIGQAMPNITDIDQQSLAGATATASHGTGAKLPALHANITAFRIALASGDIIDCSRTRNADLFHAARVSLGAFGILTDITLKNARAERVKRLSRFQKTDETLEEWETLHKSARNVEFFHLPFTGYSIIYTHEPTTEPPLPRGEESDEGLMELKRLRDLVGGWSWARRRMAEALIRETPDEIAIGEEYQMMTSHRAVLFNEMEYHLPRENFARAFREIVGAMETRREDAWFPIEARTVAADDAWLSPFYARESASIAVHAWYKEDYSFFFSLLEPIFLKYGGRPHWGKLHSRKSADFAALYPRWKEAVEIRRSVDAEGRFLNPYLRNLFGAVA